MLVENARRGIGGDTGIEARCERVACATLCCETSSCPGYGIVQRQPQLQTTTSRSASEWQTMLWPKPIMARVVRRYRAASWRIRLRRIALQQ